MDLNEMKKLTIALFFLLFVLPVSADPIFCVGDDIVSKNGNNYIYETITKGKYKNPADWKVKLDLNKLEITKKQKTKIIKKISENVYMEGITVYNFSTDRSIMIASEPFTNADIKTSFMMIYNCF